MSDAPGNGKKRGGQGLTLGPLSQLAGILMALGLLVSVVIAPVPGIVLMFVGIGCGITDVVSPGRDMYGRRRR